MMALMAYKWRRWFGSLFFALMFCYIGVNICFHAFQFGSYTGWHGKSSDGQHFYTTSTDPQGPTAALQPGDEVIAINGVHPAQDRSRLTWFDRVPPGTPFSITVQRRGEVLTFHSKTAPYPPGNRPYNSSTLIFQLLSLLFLLTGLAVLLLKPDNRQAWLLALMLGTFVGIWNSPYPYSVLPKSVEMMVACARTAAFWFFPLFLIFFLNFPERLRLLQRFPRLESWLYMPFYLFILPTIVASRLPGAWLERLPFVNWWLQRGAGTWLMGTILVYVAGGLLALVANYRAASPESRKRLRVAMAGSSAGFFMLLLLVIEATFDLQQSKGWQPVSGWLQTITPYALPLIPLSFAYAIVRHKVIPVSLIIRRSVRYLLVARGSALLVVVGIGALMFFVMDALFRLGTLGVRAVGVLSALVAILLWNVGISLHHRLIAPAIDRHFFRQAYDAQQIIADLTQALRSVTGLLQLLELVATKIQSALQTENVTIFLRAGAAGAYRNVYSLAHRSATGDKTVPATDGLWPHDAEVLKQLAKDWQPLEVELFQEQSSASGDGRRADNWEALRAVKASLLLPLATKDELLGFIALGPRLGDLPYTGEDKRLLLSVAGPTTFAIENARLVERMIEEARQRQELEIENDRRAKELEEARQLQLSLLPKTVPQLPHLEIAAYMKTATEVGGDYYDFYLAEDGSLTVAIGDATGHGLRAGTMVTAAKSIFETLAHHSDLTHILQRVNRTLRRLRLRSLFMALAMVKVNGHQLTLSSAGMPPVLIYRAESGAVEEIMLRGMPLGSVTDYPYQQQEVVLSPGDVVVLLSDGLPERFNPAGEMFDYERTKAALAAAVNHSPQQIIEHLANSGEAWAAGRPQDDDVTFVVLKLKDVEVARRAH